MTNFYKELNLDKNKTTKELQSDLIKLESTWKAREVNFPDEAIKWLSLIGDAKKIFANDSSRKQFDIKLEQFENYDPEKEKKEKYTQFVKQANDYFISTEYDLAKIAADNALSIEGANSSDYNLLALTAKIYFANSFLSRDEYIAEQYKNDALGFINKAIFCAPNDISSDYYFLRGYFYYDMKNYQRSFSSFKTAEKLSTQFQDLKTLGNVSEFLATFYVDSDIEQAEHYATQSLQFGGGSFGYATEILNRIGKIREDEQQRKMQIQKEREQKEKIYTEAYELLALNDIGKTKEAINKLNSIINYKDSAKLIEKYSKIVSEFEEQQRKDERELNARIGRKFEFAHNIAVGMLFIDIIISLIISCVYPMTQNNIFSILYLFSNAVTLFLLSFANEFTDDPDDPLSPIAFFQGFISCVIGIFFFHPLSFKVLRNLFLGGLVIYLLGYVIGKLCKRAI